MSFSTKAVNYACRDADATLRLYHIFSKRLKEEGLWDVYQTTLATQPLIHAMESTGWRIDQPYLRGLITKFDLEQQEIQHEIEQMGFGGLNCNSGPQVAQTLFAELGMTPAAYTKVAKQPSTNNKHLRALLGNHPIVQRICDVRELVKLKSIIEDVLENTDSESRLYPRLNMCGTPQGRLACRNPNLLAIPKRSEKGKSIRKGFLPPDGLELWSWDLSQADLRVLAISSEDPALVSAFNEGLDIHETTARRMFGTAYRPELRFAAKAVNFGIPMGMSEFGLTEQMHKEGLLDHTDGDSRAWLESWHEQAYPVASAFLDKQVELCKERGYVECLGGRRLYLPGVSAVGVSVRSRATRQCQSFPMAGGTQYLMHKWEAQVYREVVAPRHAKAIIQIHDDLVMAGRKEDYDAVNEAMRGMLPTEYCVPIISGDDTRGETWGDFD